MRDWLTFSNIKDVVLFALALWGAVLSTINWRQRERRSVRVSARHGMWRHPRLRQRVPATYVEATNAGHRSVTIKKLALQLPTGQRRGVAKNTQLPAELSDGKAVDGYVLHDALAKFLRESGISETTQLTPIAEDTLGALYMGEPLEVDPKALNEPS